MGGRAMHLIGFLILGAIVGWLAGKIMSGHGYGIIWDVILGIVGSFVGGFLFSLIFGTAASGLVMSFIVALIGAVLVVGIVHALRRQPIRA
jgi:uncharacterized membrane protein YeaQ/YmgE (transglycosylase-associated protein family)